uniref:Peptidase M14 carboxypeptidase A domain-containing protein n=1 Tax=Ciona savignyi TaxID=51511 RepID=H2YEX1_CIOSA
MVDQFNKDHPILIYCDLHGHSRKHHVFMYGCERKALKPKQTEATDNNLDTKPPPAKKNEDYKDAIDFVEERLFPWIMYKALPNRC